MDLEHLSRREYERLMQVIDRARDEVLARVSRTPPESRRGVERLLRDLDRFFVGVVVNGRRVRGRFLEDLQNRSDGLYLRAFRGGAETAQKELGISTGLLDRRAVIALQKFGRTWAQNLAADLRDKIKMQIQLGILNREPLQKIVKRIEGAPDLRGVFGGVRHRIRTFVRTEVARAHVMGRKSVYQKEGVEVVKFSGKPTTCPMCDPHVGKIYRMEEAPIPPLHPNCVHDLLPVTRKGELLRSDPTPLPRWDTERVYRGLFPKSPHRFRMHYLVKILREYPRESLWSLFPTQHLLTLKEIHVREGRGYSGMYLEGVITLVRDYREKWKVTLAHEFAHHIQHSGLFHEGFTVVGRYRVPLYRRWVVETYRRAVRKVLQKILERVTSPEDRSALESMLRIVDRPGFGKHYFSGLGDRWRFILELCGRYGISPEDDLGIHRAYGLHSASEMGAVGAEAYATGKAKKLLKEVKTLCRL